MCVAATPKAINSARGRSASHLGLVCQDSPRPLQDAAGDRFRVMGRSQPCCVGSVTASVVGEPASDASRPYPWCATRYATSKTPTGSAVTQRTATGAILPNRTVVAVFCAVP